MLHPDCDISHPHLEVLSCSLQCGGCRVAEHPESGSNWSTWKEPGCSQLAIQDLAAEGTSVTVVKNVCPKASRKNTGPSLVGCQNSIIGVCVRVYTQTETLWQNIIRYSLFYVALYCFKFYEGHLISEGAIPM